MKTLLFLLVLAFAILILGGIAIAAGLKFIAFCLSAWADMFRFEPSFKPSPTAKPDED